MTEDMRSTKEKWHVGYRLENDIYYMVDLMWNEDIQCMKEVAFLFDIDLPTTLLKHGHPDFVNDFANTIRMLIVESDAAGLVVIQGKFPIEEIDKMLSITGYIYKEALSEEE